MRDGPFACLAQHFDYEHPFATSSLTAPPPAGSRTPPPWLTRHSSRSALPRGIHTDLECTLSIDWLLRFHWPRNILCLTQLRCPARSRGPDAQRAGSSRPARDLNTVLTIVSSWMSVSAVAVRLRPGPLPRDLRGHRRSGQPDAHNHKRTSDYQQPRWPAPRERAIVGPEVTGSEIREPRPVPGRGATPHPLPRGSWRLLELGCGAGRLTGYLGEIASMVHGIDISPEMIAYSRRTYPKPTFARVTTERLSMGAGSSTRSSPATTCSTCPAIQIDERYSTGSTESCHHGRLTDHVVAQLGLRVASGGSAPDPHAWAASSHPQGRASPRRCHAGPLAILATQSAAVAAIQRSEPGYAIVNDYSHDYMALHYYISRDVQERQLKEHGFELVECLDLRSAR